MPVQQQMSSFARKLGTRVAEANAAHVDKPIDAGNRRLPAGIRDGIARLSTMYTKDYEDGEWKGQTFFRASAVVVAPAEHRGERVTGLITSVVIPLCDQPTREGSQRKERTFLDNWFHFQNLFKLLGVFPPDGRDGRPDYSQRAIPDNNAAGLLIEQYYFAAMRALTDPQHMKTNPVYVTFSTRGWAPPATPTQPHPEELVFETWNGVATPEQVARLVGAAGSPDPLSAVQQGPPRTAPTQTVAATPPPSAPPDDNMKKTVAELVAVAMDDPESATEDGSAASARLEQMAWGRGWSKEDTANATSWAMVGQMALYGPRPAPGTATTAPSANGRSDVIVGSRWLFAKRAPNGAKLRNSKGEEFPPQEVTVEAVYPDSQTCIVKTKDGKSVVDVRSKKPIEVKFEWLEEAPISY